MTSKYVSNVSNKHGFESNLTVNLGPCSIKGFSMSCALAETKLIEERCNNNTLKWQPQTLRTSQSIVITNRTIKTPFEPYLLSLLPHTQPRTTYLLELLSSEMNVVSCCYLFSVVVHNISDKNSKSIGSTYIHTTKHLNNNTLLSKITAFKPYF